MLLTPTDNGFNDGLDSELDTIGIRLDHPVMCGECRVKMVSKDNVNFKCPKCGKEFKKTQY